MATGPTTTRARTKRSLVGIVLLASGLVFVGIIGWWIESPSETPSPAEMRTFAYTPPVPARAPNTSARCDGEPRTIPLKLEDGPKDIPNGENCFIVPAATKGRLVLDGPDGKSPELVAGGPSIGNHSKRITRAEATSPEAELKYILCSGPGHNGWSCS